MISVDAWRREAPGADPDALPRAAPDADIDMLIGQITGSDRDAIAIVEGGAPVGIVTMRNLLLGVRGDPAPALAS